MIRMLFKLSRPQLFRWCHGTYIAWLTKNQYGEAIRQLDSFLEYSELKLKTFELKTQKTFSNYNLLERDVVFYLCYIKEVDFFRGRK